MDSYADRLMAEIAERVNARIAHREVLDHGVVALNILSTHVHALPSEGEDRTFWEWTAYQHVRDAVRKYISKRIEDDEGSDRRQIDLPGFEREQLQDYYPVKRGGRPAHVPVVDLTDEEIEAKAEEYRRMGAACYAHADELERFRHWRHEAMRPEDA